MEELENFYGDIMANLWSCLGKSGHSYSSNSSLQLKLATWLVHYEHNCFSLTISFLSLSETLSHQH